MEIFCKRILLSTSLFSLVIFAGCRTMSVENLTPTAMPMNPSGIYTLSVKAVPLSDAVDRDSVTASVVVAGEKHPMQANPVADNIFDFDYRLPEGVDTARYYFLINYRFFRPGNQLGDLREYSSDLQQFRLQSRYAISLETERAPVGTPINIFGRGFSRSDRIFVGERAADTRFISDSTLQFVIPEVQPGTSYPVELRSGRSVESVGFLRVDPANPLRVIPAVVELERGERATLVVAIDNAAISGGVPINVETDIPDSIIMPEVKIPSGARTVSVTIEGGEPGEGSLFLSGRGFSEIRVPLSVR
jgi:hypothetical protein